MPYITQAARRAIDAGRLPDTVGELTYVFTRQALSYAQTHKKRFATYAEVLAALDATAREFYRRRVAPFEDAKIAENGDVY